MCVEKCPNQLQHHAPDTEIQAIMKVLTMRFVPHFGATAATCNQSPPFTRSNFPGCQKPAAV